MTDRYEQLVENFVLHIQEQNALDRLKKIYKEEFEKVDLMKELIELMTAKVYKLEMENGSLIAANNALKGRVMGDTCSMCNWLERGDCHVQKEKLREEAMEGYKIVGQLIEDIVMDNLKYTSKPTYERLVKKMVEVFGEDWRKVVSDHV